MQLGASGIFLSESKHSFFEDPVSNQNQEQIEHSDKKYRQNYTKLISSFLGMSLLPHWSSRYSGDLTLTLD